MPLDITNQRHDKQPSPLSLPTATHCEDNTHPLGCPPSVTLSFFVHPHADFTLKPWMPVFSSHSPSRTLVREIALLVELSDMPASHTPTDSAYELLSRCPTPCSLMMR